MVNLMALIMRRFVPAYRKRWNLSVEQAKAVGSILACRTPVLGSEEYDCEHCGYLHRVYHSCRNRSRSADFF